MKQLNTSKYPKPNPTDLAWAAGIIDGEGCIHIRVDTKNDPNRKNQTPTHCLILKISMTHQPTVLKLKEMFGCGRVYMSYKGSETRNPAYSWYCVSLDVKFILEKTKKYLFTKSEEAQVAINFANLPAVQGRRNGIPFELFMEREKLRQELSSFKTRKNRNPLTTYYHSQNKQSIP